jgi:hypothetical protein
MLPIFEQMEETAPVIAEGEWHPGKLYPRVGFSVIIMARPAENVIAFYD